MARKPGNDWTRVVVLTNRNEKPGKDGRSAGVDSRPMIKSLTTGKTRIESPSLLLLYEKGPDIFQRERQFKYFFSGEKRVYKRG